MISLHRAQGRPPWPLPLTLALAPLLATATAFALSLQAGTIDACNPFWDGCTSISRAARHGLANTVFRAVMLPCALLQILFWLRCNGWLRGDGRCSGHAITGLGVIAGIALILYASFLGSDGDGYRLMRRYGITFYFAGTYLALLLSVRGLARPVADDAARPLLLIALAMLALGVVTVIVRALGVDGELKERLENAMEWQLGLWLTAMFAVFAWRWRRLRWPA